MLLNSILFPYNYIIFDIIELIDSKFCNTSAVCFIICNQCVELKQIV